MNLTLDEQKQLTEFLGGCYHELKEDFLTLCHVCNDTCVDEDLSISRLDFFDWRVTGKLLKKLSEIGLSWEIKDLPKTTKVMVMWNEAEDVIPQMAVCKAILNYLNKS